MIILTFILCSPLSALALKKRDPRHNFLPVITYHCSRRMISKNDFFSLHIYKGTWN